MLNRQKSSMTEIDKFLVEEGLRQGKPRGKLKNFYEDPDNDGWYIFIFENRSVICTIPVGISLGYFVKSDKGAVMLNPKLEIGD